MTTPVPLHSAPALPPEVEQRLRALTARWSDIGAAERANYQLYLIELAEALGVERPRPAPTGGHLAEGTAYQFEFPVRSTTRDGTVTTNFVDLYKAGCFALEAKHGEEGASDVKLLTRAFGQVSNYARDLAERPPYVLVLDVGRTLIVWDRWSGTYGGFNAGRRIDLRLLADRPDDVALLRDIWTDPSRRDPRQRAQAVTEEIATLLAELAATLERKGHDQERVARFLIRCVFTMFAEDVHLLPDASFKRLLDAVGPNGPGGFVVAAEALWKAMDSGAMFGYHKLLRFNGHFFHEAEALPLDAEELALLRRAASADWSQVEPTIFGTLLVRALTPEERHRLGAEYTPRAFIERLVRPTVEEPVRERWAAVQAEVLQLRERGRPRDLRDAETRLLEFHGWLRSLRILDPACGSGNFLYVTMHALKRVEVEVFRLLAELRGGQTGLRLDEIDPSQFHGIEVKAWAREIAELTLWIGFHQFWRQHHDVQPPEPILRDTGTLELRDAVLAWDAIVHRPEKDRPDPTPRIVHPVTGQLVPDPAAKIKYMEYVNPRQAEWPRADFIVGNPPYLGNKRQRLTLGDGYVDALRASYTQLSEAVDLVMYWWFRSANEVASGKAIRAGLLTTNTITQPQNRGIIADARGRGAGVVWAIADHPWTDDVDGAGVRITMSVLERAPEHSTLIIVDDAGRVIETKNVPLLNPDLSSFADVATHAQTELSANRGLSFRGVIPLGLGFLLDDVEATNLLAQTPDHKSAIAPFLTGKDVNARARGMWIIDFALKDENEVRERYPILYDLVRDRVRPQRLGVARKAMRERWWRYGEARPGMRSALHSLPRFLVTSRAAKHRFFEFVAAGTVPDDTLVVVSSDSPFLLGAMSSTIHTTWARAAGATLEDRPLYNNVSCFDPFPFPDPPDELRTRIADLAERLDAHRKDAIARDERVTMTGMYNVVEKLRSGEPLTTKERTVHELAACGVLRDLHDELDALVAEAYGWRWPMAKEEILERLVALHDERVEEEARGIVRWLRPDFQAPDAARAPARGRDAELPLAAAATAGTPDAAPEWPTSAVEQIAALKSAVARQPATVDEVARRFRGARRDLVARHLETLAILGELRQAGGRYSPAASY